MRKQFSSRWSAVLEAGYVVRGNKLIEEEELS